MGNSYLFKYKISLASFLWDVGKQCKTRSDAVSSSPLFAYRVSLKFEQKWKIPTNNSKIGNGLI